MSLFTGNGLTLCAPKWPGMIWEDVSANYSGVFFRVVGGEAAPFGEIQMENTTRINKISSVLLSDVVKSNYGVDGRNSTVPLHGQSRWFFTGSDTMNTNQENYVSIELSGGEVRPKNMAMKIWRRIS